MILHRIALIHLNGVLAFALASGQCGGQAGTSGGSGTSTVVPAWEDITPPAIDRDAASFQGSNYGLQAVLVDPVQPTTVYFSTCYQGIWKSIDSGDNWVKLNTGTNGDQIDAGRAWSLVIDHSDANQPAVLYTTSGWGALGIWKSTDGGTNWAQLFVDDSTNPTPQINTGGGIVPDILSIAMDPYDHQHLIATFHDVAWKGYGDAGLIESKDAGASWKLIPPASGLGVGQCAYFLGDSNTWLVASNSTNTGSWLVTDDGSGNKTFRKISDSFTGGGCQMYRAGNGAWYIGGGSGVLRSTDSGLTWTTVSNQSSVQGIVGDGDHIYATTGFPSVSSATDFNPTQWAPESAGDTGWQVYGNQTFNNGGRELAADPARHLIFSAAWRQGLLRLKTQ